jgi:zinc/manganese transport system substrate-binding protein/manganese/iron transport system substrate-binding protein
MVMAILAGLLLSACGSAPGSAGPDASAPVEVAATTSVLADLVRQVGGGRVAVSSLVPKGGEVHTFDPSPRDAARLADADLIVANGLGLDDWLTGLAADSGVTAPIVRLGEDLPSETYIDGGGTAGAVNPHLWLDPELAIDYVARIADALGTVDPGGSASYREAAADTASRLEDLDRWATDRLATIPASKRRIVSFHDALPYLARAFGIEIVGIVVAAPGQEPSAGEIAALVDEVERTGVSAIVSEAQFNDELVRSIAEDTGATVVSDLYTDSLGDPPVDTYDGLIRWDVDRLATALEAPP